MSRMVPKRGILCPDIAAASVCFNVCAELDATSAGSLPDDNISHPFADALAYCVAGIPRRASIAGRA